MKVTGSAILHAPADRVWAALNDPAVLVRTIPGCQALEAAGPDRYRMTITAGVASIRGSYSGDVELADPRPPASFTLRASGSGAPGTVRADVRVTLEPDGDNATQLRYDAVAEVGGAVGGVGQRVLGGVAKRTAGEFFAAVDAALNEPAAPAAATGTDRPEPGDVQRAARGRTFVRPARGTAAADLPGGQGAGFLLGAAVALAGVLVGWRIGRRG